MGTYLIQDPHHAYASRFIHLLRERYGHRPIAFFTRSARERFYRRAECLPDSEFAAIYEVDPAELDGFAAHVRREHPDLKGIIPYSEETLELTAALADRLRWRWNEAETLARFRNKSALKAHLRRTAPSLRLNFACKVCSADEVFSLGPALPSRFVLKPDSGFGSRGVGVFTSDERARVQAFFIDAPGTYVLEEFVEGTLYAVDGVVDAQGRTLVVSIFSSGRRTLNGSPVVYSNGAQVHEDTVLFAELAAYARDVIAASGLRRSPFHMEVMRDARGPCLIEVGARLVGHSHAWTCERVHGGSLDFFGIAAAGYLGERMDLELSFAHYNRVHGVKVYGASEVEGTAYAVHGVEDVEALPSFDRWIVRPMAGARLHRTVDLFTVPYSLVLIGERGREDVVATGEQVHRMLSIDTAAPLLSRVRVDGETLATKVRARLGWMTEQARRSVMGGRG
jgi:hypothetical protein